MQSSKVQTQVGGEHSSQTDSNRREAEHLREMQNECDKKKSKAQKK